MGNNNPFAGIQVTGPNRDVVRRAMALLNNPHLPPVAMTTPPPPPPPVPTTCGDGCSCNRCSSGGNVSPVLTTQSCGLPDGPGALAYNISCLTTGATLPVCAPGTFGPYYTSGGLTLLNTPTRVDFDVPCHSARSFFDEIADRCESEVPVIVTAQTGQNVTNQRCGTQAVVTVTDTTVALEINAPLDPLCEMFTPGLRFSFGFSQNTPLAPIQIEIDAFGQDGCPITVRNIQALQNCLGVGTLAYLFNCDIEQRLYPALAMLSNGRVLIPAGTELGGLGTTSSNILYPNKNIQVRVSGPSNMSVTVQNLTWKDPALACIYNLLRQSNPGCW